MRCVDREIKTTRVTERHPRSRAMRSMLSTNREKSMPHQVEANFFQRSPGRSARATKVSRAVFRFHHQRARTDAIFVSECCYVHSPATLVADGSLPDRHRADNVRGVLRRLVAAIALLALASMPVAARTRLICRYTGVEITDCRQGDVPGSAEIQLEGCCDRRTTQPPCVLLILQPPFSPLLIALPGLPMFATPLPPPLPSLRALETSPPVFLITRALLI